MSVPHLSKERNRHGRTVYYARIGTIRERVAAQPDDENFWPLFREALARVRARTGGTMATEAPAAAQQVRVFSRGTFGHIAHAYMTESAAFARLNPAGQKRRRKHLCDLIDLIGSKPALMPAATIEAGLAKRAAQPGKANEWLKSVKALYSWAESAKLVASNPADSVRKIAIDTEGFHIWTLEEIAAYAVRHPPGSAGWLALMVLMFTGLRREDASRLGRQHVSAGAIRFKTGKTGAMLVTAIAPPLARAIAEQGETGQLAFLLTNHGRPFKSGNAFGNWFKDRCREAGIAHCTAHGVRKAGASLAAEAGATDHQIDAMYTWTPAEQNRTYTAAARKLKLASDGFNILARALAEAGILPAGEQNAARFVAPFQAVTDGATKTGG